MTVRVYRSTDSGAPSIGRSIGSLITLLDAVLVNGYGSKSPLGWTKQFSGTNVAMYLQGTGSSGCTLYVSHTTADYASVTGLVNPTSISDTTKNQFYQASYQQYLAAPENKWVVVGNEKAFYIFTSWNAWGPMWGSLFFGDIASYGGTADLYRCLSAGSIATPTVTGPGNDSLIGYSTDTTFTVGTGATMAGTKTEIASTNVGFKHVGFARSTNSPFPNKFSSNIVLYPRWVHTSIDVRGELPGCYVPHQALELYGRYSGTFSGSGTLTGKTFELFTLSAYTVFAIETSDTWSN